MPCKRASTAGSIGQDASASVMSVACIGMTSRIRIADATAKIASEIHTHAWLHHDPCWASATPMTPTMTEAVP